MYFSTSSKARIIGGYNKLGGRIRPTGCASLYEIISYLKVKLLILSYLRLLFLISILHFINIQPVD